MRDGVDDDVASRPGRAPYGAANNTRDSAAGPNRAAGVPYKDPDLPYPPIQGRWEASLPEKTWEECTLLPKKHHTAHCSEKIVTLKKASHCTLHTSKKAPRTQIFLPSQLFYAE